MTALALRRFARVTISVAVAVVVMASVAAATFVSTRTSTQTVGAASIPTPSLTSASASGATVTLVIAQITLTGGRPLTLQAERLNASTSASAGVVACTPTATGCQVDAVPAGTWRFRVRGAYGAWTGSYSTTSGDISVGHSGTLTVAASPQKQNSNKGKFTFGGAGNVAAVSIVVTVYTDSDCTTTTGQSVTSSPAGAGSWGPTGSTGSLDDNQTYWVLAVQGGNSSACVAAAMPNY